MASTPSPVPTAGFISTISSWFSRDSEEKPVAKVVFKGTKITDSIYDLRPVLEQVEDFNVEIVFFHGLQRDQNNMDDAYFMTWVTETDPPRSWPATLLPKLFPKARLLSIKYDGAVTKGRTTGRDDLDTVVENLVVDLIRSNRPFGAGVGQTRAPVIFVTHCLGGVVAQKFILEVDKQLLHRPDDLKLKNFWNNLGGIVYYSPLVHGSDQLVKATSYSATTKGPLVKFMDVLAKENARILQDFTNLLDSERLQPKPASLVLTMTGGFNGEVVQEDSSRLGDSFVTVKGDHFSVCQAEDETSQSFQHLPNFAQEVVRNYLSAGPRPRRDAISSEANQEREQSSAGGDSKSSSTTLDMEQGVKIVEQGQRHVKNITSEGDLTLSKLSAAATRSQESLQSSRSETAEKLVFATPIRSISAGGYLQSTELTFFKSYD